MKQGSNKRPPCTFNAIFETQYTRLKLFQIHEEAVTLIHFVAPPCTSPQAEMVYAARHEQVFVDDVTVQHGLGAGWCREERRTGLPVENGY